MLRQPNASIEQSYIAHIEIAAQPEIELPCLLRNGLIVFITGILLEMTQSNELTSLHFRYETKLFL